MGIYGPPDTIYEGGYFKAQLVFPPEYPMKPPDMKFLCDMFHPNVYADGESEVCADARSPLSEHARWYWRVLKHRCVLQRLQRTGAAPPVVSLDGTLPAVSCGK